MRARHRHLPIRQPEERYVWCRAWRIRCRGHVGGNTSCDPEASASGGKARSRGLSQLDEAMSPQLKPLVLEMLLPSESRADVGLVEETSPLLLCGQSSELCSSRVVARYEQV